MKNCTAALARHLNSDNEFICCDLFTLKLADNTVYRTAEFDKDVSFNNSVAFTMR